MTEAMTVAPQPAPQRRFTATSADGVTLTAQDWGGEGAHNLVLIHGYGQDHRVWGGLPLELAAAGVAVYSYDLRGHGGSDRPQAPAAYQDGRHWAEDLRAVLDALPRRPAVLVGWSYAGRVVVDYLRYFGAEDLAGLCLIGASTQDGDGFLAPEVMGMAEAIASGDKARSAATLDRLVRLFFHAAPGPELVAQLLATARGAAPEALRWMNDRPLDGDALLQALDLPFLILQGAEDRIVLTPMARHMAAQVTGAELVLMPDIGHMPFLEDPEATAGHLRAWIAGL
ncbi:MAG: alpha/beta fold hydrolase [Kiloniellaceae bacterium]